nr:hypothetical protein [Tanacetum cinerariifolium]
MDASGGSGRNSPVFFIDNNGAMDMNGTMDNLEERITNLEMMFAYLKNKKMLERPENKSNRVTTSSDGTADEDIAELEVASKSKSFTSKPKKNDAFHCLEGLNRELKHCRLNIKDNDHPIITTLDIPHGLHRGRNFLESFDGHSNDPMTLLMKIPHMLHLEGKIFESCGCLLLVCKDDIGSNNFTIYEIMKGPSVCSVRYLVNIEQLMHPLSKGWSIRTSVWSICLGEGGEDALAVINISEKVIKYNLISKTTTEVFDIRSNQMDDDDDDAVEFIPPFEVDPNMYEFRLSLACVLLLVFVKWLLEFDVKIRVYCNMYQYSIDHGFDNNKGENAVISGGPPATVFLNQLPEVVLDLRRRRSSCVGVVECCMELSCFLKIFTEVKRALKTVGMSTFNVQGCRLYKSMPALKRVTDEIEEALVIVCESHDLPAAQVWIPYENENYLPFEPCADRTQTKGRFAVKLRTGLLGRLLKHTNHTSVKFNLIATRGCQTTTWKIHK